MLISRGLSLLAFMVVARKLGKEHFGELGIVQNTLMLFQVFAGLGLGQTAVKYVSEYREKSPEKAGRVIALLSLAAVVTGGLASLVFWSSAPYMARSVLAAPDLALELRIASLLLIISTLIGVQTSILSGFEAFKAIARIHFVVGVFSFPLIASGAYYGGLKGAIWGLVASQAVNLIVCQSAIFRESRQAEIHIIFTGCMEELAVLWRYSLPALLIGIVASPINWVCYVILVNQPQGYAEMGAFNAANQWFAMLIFLPMQLSRVILPVLSERMGQQDMARSRKILTSSIACNAAIVFPVIIVASLASPFIMGFYGEGFRDAWPTLILVVLSAGIVAIQTPIGQTLWASAKVWRLFAINITWGGVFLGLTWFWRDSGSLGLAGARLAAFGVSSILVFGNAFIILRLRGNSAEKQI